MFKPLIILIFLLPFLSFGQTEVFLDENMNQIDKKTYNKKCKINIYYCKKDKTDTTIVNKLYYKYQFGKVSNEDFQILKTFFFKSTGIKFSPTSNIIIKYNDSLFGYKSTEEKRKIQYNKHLNRYNNSISNIRKKGKFPEFVPHTLKAYTKSHISFINRQKKCIELVNKNYNSNAIFLYQFDLDHNIMWPDLNWIQDKYGLFKQLFFKIPNFDGMLILKPDGNFFVSNTILSEKVFSILLNGDWSNIKQDWIKTKQKYIKKGFGLFKLESNFKRKNCF